MRKFALFVVLVITLVALVGCSGRVETKARVESRPAVDSAVEARQKAIAELKAELEEIMKPEFGRISVNLVEAEVKGRKVRPELCEAEVRYERFASFLASPAYNGISPADLGTTAERLNGERRQRATLYVKQIMVALREGNPDCGGVNRDVIGLARDIPYTMNQAGLRFTDVDFKAADIREVVRKEIARQLVGPEGAIAVAKAGGSDTEAEGKADSIILEALEYGFSAADLGLKGADAEFFAKRAKALSEGGG